MDERDHQEQKPLDHLRELNPLHGVMTPPQSLDESPSMANRRRARPFSMLSYNNPILTQPSNSPSPLYPEPHSRNASFSSAPRSLAHPVLGTPSKRPTTRWTVIIIPPALLPHSPPPPHVSGFAHGYGASGRYSAGLLLPLQATLTLQLASIAREFSLPSTGGLSLHLSISSVDQPPIPGPRVTDESWSVLFGWAFEDNPPACAGLQAATGLPIAGRLEFDIDLKKARWFDAWAAAAQPSNRTSSQVQQSLKLTSSNFTLGLARGSEPMVASSSSPGVRTLITSTRRSSCKSSATDDSLRDHNKHLPNGQSEHVEGQPRSPTSIKSTQASPSRYASGSQDSRMPVSPATISSAETHHRQQLERLVESEELSAAEEDNWHIQQQNMLRQATLEREQIELADQLEDERKVREEQEQSSQSHHQLAMSTTLLEGSSSKSIGPSAVVEAHSQQPINSFNRPHPDLARSIGFQETGSSQTTPVRNWQPNEVIISLQPTESANHPDMTRKESSNYSSDRVEMEDLSGPIISGFSPTKAAHVIGDNSTRQNVTITTSESTEAEPSMNRSRSADHEETSITSELLTDSETIRAEQDSVASVQRITSRSPETQTSMARSISDGVLKTKTQEKVEGGNTLSNVGSLRPGAEEVAGDETRSKRLSDPARQHQSAEGSSFSSTLGRSVNRFSGEQELIKRRLKTQQGDEETQKLIDEMNRLVNEKAMAKEAMILSNPPLKMVRDDEPALPPPVKETPRAPPPPPTRSKVIQLAKSFGSADHSPSTSTHSSPKCSGRTLESSPTIHPAPLPPARSEPDLEFLAHPPVIQGPSSSHSTPQLNGQRSADHRIEPLPANPTSKSSPSSVTSSPSTRSLSLFKPRLSIGNNLLSNIFRSQTSSNVADPPPVVVDPLAPILHCYESPDGMSQDLTNYIISAQDQALERHQKFTLALSGGSLPNLIASGLIENPKVKWESWKVFFADERIVPLDHEDSNFANSMKALFEKVPIDRSQIVSIMGLPPDDIDLDEMAPVVSSIYMAQVLEELDWSADGNQLPRFDLILLGMGPDGHTCSLFPSHKLLDEEAIVSWCNDSPKPPAHRITMSLSVLNAAHELAFICAGASKEEALAAVLDKDPSPTRPASLVKLPHKPIVWFVDQAAAAKTQYPRSAAPVSAHSTNLPESPVRSFETSKLGGLQLEGIEPTPAVQVQSMDSSDIAQQGVVDDLSVSQCRPEDVPASQLSPLIGRLNGEAVDLASLGYPYSLRVYPAVYPYINELLYCPAPPIIEHLPRLPQSISLYKAAELESVTTNPTARQEIVEEVIDVSDNSVKETCQETNSEQLVDLDRGVDLDEVVGSDQVVNLDQVKDFDQTTDSAGVKDLEISKSNVLGKVSMSKVDLGYPLNLSIYPSVYPHLEEMLYAPLFFNLEINTPRTENLHISPLVSLKPDLVEEVIDSHALKHDLVEELIDSRKAVAPQLEQPPPSCWQVEESFGYPYNLIVYRAVYPHVEDFMYPPLPARLAEVQLTRQAKRAPAPFAPFSAQINGSRGIAYQVSPGLESGPTSPLIDQAAQTTIIEPKSPVMAMQTTLSPAFHSPLQPSQVTPTTRIFTPSLQYSQLDSEHRGSLTPAVSPLALHALPSTLQQEYFGEIQAPHYESEESDGVPRSKLPTSPVEIIPSHLPQSFYPTDNPEPIQQARKIISPSLPYTHQVTATDGVPVAVPGAALQASPSALGIGFFGGTGEASTTREMNIESVEDLHKADEENHHQVETDRESEGSYSQFSKGDLSMNSQTTLHQLTDDDWPPTPPSPDRLPSPDLMSRLATTPSTANHINGSTDANTIQPQFPSFKSHQAPAIDQSSSALIESEQEVHMSSMAEASLITPSVAHFHDQAVVEIPEGSNAHPEDAVEFHAESTPRASAQSQLEEIPYMLSTSPESIVETPLDLDSLPEILPTVADPHVEVSPLQPALTNGLGLELGETEVKSDKLSTPTNSSHVALLTSRGVEGNQGDLKHAEGLTQTQLVPSSGLSECQMNSLRLLGEMDVDDMVSEISPPRLASPPLMERLFLTPCATPTFAKQFPTYQAALTTDDEESFLSPPKIEADWHIPQVSLSDASAPSPPRTLPLPIHPPHCEPSERGSLVSSELSVRQNQSHHSTSPEEVSTPTAAPILDDLVIPSTSQIDPAADMIEEARSDSPFFLDQSPGPACVDQGSSANSSPVHALTVDSVVPVEHSIAGPDFNQQFSSQLNSPIFPPLNLTMDLSDPLSAASTSRYGMEDDTVESADIGAEQSPSDQSSFENQSNGYNLDRIRELSGQTPVTDNSEDVESEIQHNVSELLPAITKRPPTPTNNEHEVTVESVSIDDATPPPPSPILLPFQDVAEISEALAQFVFEAQEVAIQRHGKFQLALGGSILPQILGEGLVGDDRIRWESWELFLVEESIAPLGSPHSVLSAVTESIIQHVPIPRSQVHSIAELTQADIEETKTIPEGLDSLADSLADEYENRLIELFPEASHETGQPPEFDLILISVGEEGQVGSLYPSHPMLGESNWFVAWLGDAWDPPSHRITLTLPVLNSARQFAFLAVGAELAEIVSDGLDRSIQSDVPMEEDRVNPAALVKSSNLKPVVWFTDFAAASLTDYPKSAFWDEP
ncbi:hypothetical protein PGTUg99_005587 [Puccinia graminis f. sp. tritici]|uniref:6-phosphogluconolactonase n=1 Tax=Puccinia graminis f. sp. tritici TaxID=56615 RepID=A0A5B0SHF1_PUCGR|nr:hypothetical protein PGTUg99_005587 [Puccinia graminis f. sp. tritici]